MKHAKSKSKKFWTIIGAIVLLLSVGYFALNTRTNYAQETAKPLEKALVGAGGKIISSGGDAGRGIDNQTPYYDVTLDMPLNEEDTIKLVGDISNNNGYKLTHASPDQRGHLGAVADKYIDEWYFDNTNKANLYSQLKQGNIKLAFHFGDEDMQIQNGHTVVRLNLQLPEFK